MRALIAASGSGGHLFPAVYIAQTLRELESEMQIAFVGSGRPLEEKILGSEGSKVLVLPVQGLKSRGIKGIFDFICSIPSALFQTRKIFRDNRPHIVIGVGGYVTFFPIIFARFMGIPSWIHEAELKPGLANYVLSYFATKISVAFEAAQMPNKHKVVFTGHPVRSGLEVARNFEALTKPPRNILVLGGSQGAHALDVALPELSSLIKENGLQIVHQCRSDNIEQVKNSYLTAGVKAEIVPFIEDMASAYQWADIIVSRSGAGSIMEIGIVNKPTIFVPFPFAQGNHQVANAQTLVSCGKALLCEEGPRFLQRLEESFKTVLSLERYNQMKLAKTPGRTLDAARKIAEGCLDLIK